MSNKTYERLAVVGRIAPDNHAAGSYTTDVIDLANTGSVTFFLQVGTLGVGGTVDFLVNSADNSGMANSTTLPNTSITQLTQAGGNGDEIVIVHVDSIDAGKLGHRYIQGALTVGTASCYVGVLALADGLRYLPATQPAFVIEVVD